MNLDDFLTIVSEHMPAIIASIFGILSALSSLIITFLRTRQKSIQMKVNKCVVSGEHNLDLSKYYVIFAGKKYFLDKLEIHFEGVNDYEKNESKKI